MLLFPLGAAAAAGIPPAGYNKLPNTDLAWLDPVVPRVGPCGRGTRSPCNVTALASACNALGPTRCTAFNTNGFLKHCPGGRCGCDAGADACTQASPGTDTYVVAEPPPPAAWAAAAANASLLYAAGAAVNACYLPEVGNGYLGTVATWGALYVGGLFNGRCGSVHKARLPSPVAVDVAAPGATLVASALDLRRAAFLRRWAVPAGGGAATATVEQRVYAHRTRRHIVAMELELLPPPAGAVRNLTIALTSLWDPAEQRTDLPGNGCAGGFTKDFALVNTTAAGASASAFDFVTTARGDDGELFNVSAVTDTVPASLTLHIGEPARFLTAVATSVDFVLDPGLAARAGGSDDDRTRVRALAVAAHAAAAAAAAAGSLVAEHEAAWAELWRSGIDVAPPASGADEDGADADGPARALGGRALDVARHANASHYFVLSSVRADWPVGISPGGLATPNYRGAVFFDMDWYVAPPLRLLRPALAAALLEYRFDSLPASRAVAASMGHAGAQFAWTAAYRGRPFGCCSGRGGYEDCLEQHVTGDVATAAWRFYVATRNASWLAARGWPLLAGAGAWAASRVTPAPRASDPVGTAYHVRGVLPVDEWCVNAGCGCQFPGVDDDVQTNAVVKLALRYGATVAARVGGAAGAAEAALWNRTAAGVVVPFDAALGRHVQFTSPTCPGGVGKRHYVGTHTVCPEDVLYLSYPLGEALGTTANATRGDAAFFAPKTCKENAGMTGPVHAAVWLDAGRPDLAQAALNRSLHAACYGPFLVRNEVDKHADIVGGHQDNTHFVTGDGGLLQALMNGYLGIRETDAGLLLRRPALPAGVGALRARGVRWAGTLVLDVTAKKGVLELRVAAADANGRAATEACVVGAGGRVQKHVVVGGAGRPASEILTLPLASYPFPARVQAGKCT